MVCRHTFSPIMIKDTLPYKNLAHGQCQVRSMVRDRPAMGTHMARKDLIWQWAARKFAGEDLQETIDWSNKAPYHGAKASHRYPCRTERGSICIRKNLPFEASWAGVIFELYNIALYPEFKAVIQKAYKGKIKKKDFILKMAYIEFKAVKRAEQFYKDVWLPWAMQKKLSTCPGEWSVGLPRACKAWIRCFDKQSDYPWKVYADFYENYLKAWAVADVEIRPA